MNCFNGPLFDYNHSVLEGTFEFLKVLEVADMAYYIKRLELVTTFYDFTYIHRKDFGFH
jgi:hypothetical protein